MRFVEGRLVSAISIRFLEWACQKMAEMEFRLQALLALEGCAWALASTGQAALAASLLGAASAFRESSGAVVFPRDRPVYDKTIAGLKCSLGEKRYNTAWRDGYQVGFDQSIRDLLTIEIL